MKRNLTFIMKQLQEMQCLSVSLISVHQKCIYKIREGSFSACFQTEDQFEILQGVMLIKKSMISKNWLSVLLLHC